MVALIKLLIGSKIQAHLGDIVAWVPEHLKKNKSILLVDRPASFSLSVSAVQ